MPKLAVLASGTGTILESILAAGLPVGLVLSDRPCRALEVARDRGIAAVLLDRRRFGFRPSTAWDRAGFTAEVADTLDRHGIGLVAMAGFMTVLAPAIFDRYPERIINTHPSLLPRFRGHDAVPQALAAAATQTGCTVHVATPDLDSGRILDQASVQVLPGDTEATLHERIKTVERRLYPEAIRSYLDNFERGQG